MHKHVKFWFATAFALFAFFYNVVGHKLASMIGSTPIIFHEQYISPVAFWISDVCMFAVLSLAVPNLLRGMNWFLMKLIGEPKFRSRVKL